MGINTDVSHLTSSPIISYCLETARIGFVILAAIAVIISSAIRIFIELFQFVQLGVWNYLKDWVNWIELTLFTTSIIFAVVFFTDCLCPMSVV